MTALPDTATDALLPEVCTARDAHVEACTTVRGVPDAAEHDYRRYRHAAGHRESFRCVWCHVVACGDVGEHDPCMRPYHHRTGHRSLTGVEWPLGGSRS